MLDRSKQVRRDAPMTRKAKQLSQDRNQHQIEATEKEMALPSAARSMT